MSVVELVNRSLNEGIQVYGNEIAFPDQASKVSAVILNVENYN